MLHAVLAALNQQNRAGKVLGGDGDGDGGRVPTWWWRGRAESVTPKLVAGFVLPGVGSKSAVEGDEGEEGEESGKKKKKTGRGANSAYQLLKQGKIKLLTELLEGGMVQPEEGRVSDMVTRFLEEAERKATKTRRKKVPGDADMVDIGKMDDLSDSLLQGMTWVQWQNNLETLIRERPELLEPVDDSSED
ncbi:hypothetical protein VTJ49DRAFT_5290 [Mycothermus thermophilus]